LEHSGSLRIALPRLVASVRQISRLSGAVDCGHGYRPQRGTTSQDGGFRLAPTVTCKTPCARFWPLQVVMSVTSHWKVKAAVAASSLAIRSSERVPSRWLDTLASYDRY